MANACLEWARSNRRFRTINDRQQNTETRGDQSGGGDRASRLLLTGASGFIGRHLLPLLESRGYNVITLCRDGLERPSLDLDADASIDAWTRGLGDIGAVIHLAGIAHQLSEPAELDRVNAQWPQRLFEAAARAGVRDFVFLSSVKVLGDVSIRPLRVDDPYAPGDAYGRSKVKAEQSLLEAQMRHPEISLVILRIPLVYGPGVKANFRTLLRWAARGRRGFVLPFGRARSPRSIISVRNLCDALSASIGHRGIFHCADATDVSVAELFEKLGVPASRLLPVPAWIMRLMLTACGRSAFFERLYLPLQLDTDRTSSELGWEPGHPTDRELAELIMETDA